MIPNYNEDLGYHFGVHQANRSTALCDVLAGIMENGRNLSYEQYIQDTKERFCSWLREGPEDGVDTVIREALDAIDFNERDINGGLITDLRECFDDLSGPDCDEAWEVIEQTVNDWYDSNEDVYLYEDEEEGLLISASCLGGAYLIFVEKSPWVCRARKCSPCVPGAGDLDTPDEDGDEVLCLPPRFFTEAAEECPYVGVRRISEES